jgi:hypothetical protein
VRQAGSTWAFVPELQNGSLSAQLDEVKSAELQFWAFIDQSQTEHPPSAVHVRAVLGAFKEWGPTSTGRLGQAPSQ